MKRYHLSKLFILVSLVSILLVSGCAETEEIDTDQQGVEELPLNTEQKEENNALSDDQYGIDELFDDKEGIKPPTPTT